MGDITRFSQSLTVHKNNLEKYKPEFAKVLPAHITADKIARSVMNALSANEYLATNCDPTSVVQSAMTAAVLGLEVDNALGQGYITPFKGKAQFIVGYKGYITLAQNSGFIVSGQAVREKDQFSYQQGLKPDLVHIPFAGSPSSRGQIIYAYAVARHKSLPSIFNVVHIEDINKIRDGSEAYKAYMAGKIKSTPWVDNYEKMAIKTAIRSLASQLPMNVQKAAAIESIYETGKSAYLDDRGDIYTPQASEDSGTKEQPDLSAELGLTICGTCGGTGEYEAAGMKGPCPHCKS
jgi:recombination protein RecT